MEGEGKNKIRNNVILTDFSHNIYQYNATSLLCCKGDETAPSVHRKGVRQSW